MTEPENRDVTTRLMDIDKRLAEYLTPDESVTLLEASALIQGHRVIDSDSYDVITRLRAEIEELKRYVDELESDYRWYFNANL